MDKYDILQQLQPVFPGLARSYDHDGLPTNVGDPIAQVVVDLVNETWQPVEQPEQFAAISYELEAICARLTALYQRAKALEGPTELADVQCLAGRDYSYYHLDCLNCDHFIGNHNTIGVQCCEVRL